MLAEHSALARRVARLQFLMERPGHYLLGEVIESFNDEAPAFATSVRHIDGIKNAIALKKKEEEDALGSGLFLLRVEKTKKNNWSQMITLGRAQNNDVVIRHRSVSKLHAHLQMKPSSEDPASPSAFWLADAGSSNGTWVNGKVLEQGTPVLLKPGDRIIMGDVSFLFMDSSFLYDALRKLPRTPTSLLPLL